MSLTIWLIRAAGFSRLRLFSGWLSDTGRPSLGVHSKRSFGVQFSARQIVSMCQTFTFRTRSFIKLLAVAREKPSLTKYANGLSIPRRANMRLNLKISIEVFGSKVFTLYFRSDKIAIKKDWMLWRSVRMLWIYAGMLWIYVFLYYS